MRHFLENFNEEFQLNENFNLKENYHLFRQSLYQSLLMIIFVFSRLWLFLSRYISALPKMSIYTIGNFHTSALCLFHAISILLHVYTQSEKTSLRSIRCSNLYIFLFLDMHTQSCYPEKGAWPPFPKERRVNRLIANACQHFCTITVLSSEICASEPWGRSLSSGTENQSVLKWCHPAQWKTAETGVRILQCQRYWLL